MFRKTQNGLRASVLETGGQAACARMCECVCAYVRAHMRRREGIQKGWERGERARLFHTRGTVECLLPKAADQRDRPSPLERSVAGTP